MIAFCIFGKYRGADWEKISGRVLIEKSSVGQNWDTVLSVAVFSDGKKGGGGGGGAG
jgi:hypothetical protein